MDSEVHAHYHHLLAGHYTWMATGGDYGAGVQENEDLLASLNLAPEHPDATALDLGCGPGMQSAALLLLGYDTVLAVDLCEPMLDELRRQNAAHVDADHLRARVGNLTDPDIFPDEPSLALTLCWGDTLTHLSSKADVPYLFARAHAALRPAGRLALRFRDLTRVPTGPDRFIPVRSDANTIMTCFLEEAGPEYLGITDLIHTRQPDDGWRLRMGAYRKLRLGAGEVAGWLREAGFTLEHEDVGPGGMVTLIGRRA